MIACVCAWKSTLWGLFEVFNEERGDESQLQDHPLTHAYMDASAHTWLGHQRTLPLICKARILPLFLLHVSCGIQTSLVKIFIKKNQHIFELPSGPYLQPHCAHNIHRIIENNRFLKELMSIFALFCLTAKFLGKQLLSYGQYLTMSFTAESSELLSKTVTVVLKGSGLSVSANMFSNDVFENVDSDPSHTPHNIFTLRYVYKNLYNVCVHWASFITQDTSKVFVKSFIRALRQMWYS